MSGVMTCIRNILVLLDMDQFVKSLQIYLNRIVKVLQTYENVKNGLTNLISILRGL